MAVEMMVQMIEVQEQLIYVIVTIRLEYLATRYDLWILVQTQKVEIALQLFLCSPRWRIDSRKVCNTEDEPCLRAHKSAWWSVLPHTPDAEESSSYDKAIGDGNEFLKCTNCYPACTDTHYYLQMQATPLERGNRYHTELLPHSQTRDQSILHIYFKKFGSVRLKQDMGYYWYELISDIGGTCGVFVGFSLLSIIEFLYFILRCVLVPRSQGERLKTPKSKDQLRSNVMTVDGGLYWNEIMNHPEIYFAGRKSRKRIGRY
ncbi:uncharacterized protein [Fopius arisanus]|uniref:Sodium channel protein Nach n=1 Tax=Fopius arisanus TaxID=64838 RepID=A0A9R1SWU7_9HYME|nr:PREDICTED: uncharacterized protein LOC105263822 [Fopius arisanus]